MTTPRLLLTPLTIADAAFIHELVNSPEWIQFIGNRNVGSGKEAIAYIERILANPSVTYHVVRIKEDSTPVGVITVIKRDYLEHLDIGFAFLARYSGKGYAYESAKAVINTINEKQLKAITLKDNTNSIKLLERLGFSFEKEIMPEKELLLLYTMQL